MGHRHVSRPIPSTPEHSTRSPLPPRSRDLRSPSTPLIGRDRELAELGRQLFRPDVRLLTLTGPAGTGKTRLAVELAARHVDRFEHGCVFVDLAPIRDPALVISTIATAVGLPEVGSQPLVQTVKHFLGDRHLLVVLDQFEQVLAAAPLLAELLAESSRLKLLVTSRATLRLWRWEHQFPVAPLELPDPRRAYAPASLETIASLALFAERARARRPDFALSANNASAVAEICVRLDGLPLAIELAAGGIKLLSPQAMLSRLQARLDLVGEGGGHVADAHQTLHQAIGWTYDLLGPPEQALLRRLAVFVGGFSVQAAQAICVGGGIAAGEIPPLLARLVDHSLVVADERGPETRYRLLEAIRDYAGQQLAASGEAERHHRRHAEWFVQLGRRAAAELRSAQQSAWLDELEADHDNLRAALDWLTDVGEERVGPGLRLATVLAAVAGRRSGPTSSERQGRTTGFAPAAARLETRYARSGDVNIAYQVVGQGPIDLVFVMGWVSHLDYFWQEPRFARFLRRLASFSRLILFDKRGTGLSDRGVGIPTLEQRMDDVRAVLDAVGSERAVLLGVSEGGALCMLFAATYPRRTSALALVGCFPRRLHAPDYPWGEPVREREQRLQGVEDGWGSVEWATADLERRAPTAAHDAAFTHWWSTYLRMSASPGAASALLRMNTEIDIRPVLPSIGVPTLIVHRREDRTVSVEAGRYLAAQMPGARYVELPGQDHLPFVGDQDAILDAVEAFLTGVPPAAQWDRVVATVLAMEVVDAATTVASLGDRRWREVQAAYAAVVRDNLERFRGRPAGATGTAFLATFDGPARGIRCASTILDQSRLLGIELRAGLHTGECDLVDGEPGGPAFRVATWVMAQAPPGDVLTSSTVRDLVVGSGLPFEEWQAPAGPEWLGRLSLFRLARDRRPQHSTVEGGPVPPPSARTGRGDPLTRREREVATLLARGLTNRQIGHELVISPATAERHVVNIFNKLGFHSRTQLAAWVVEHGLGQPPGEA
jgi:predicted ATPase/pimeloyl-ACP methyl ester carboxylesterase/DNA-binding CsgD family transcriptional regulator